MTVSIKISRVYFFLLLVIVGTLTLPASPAYSAVGEKQKAPSFTLVGLDGRQHTLPSTGQPRTVLFFFCGCKWCHDAARNWAAVQKHGGSAQSQDIVIVYAGGADEARGFAKQTGLDLSRTIILLDKSMAVTYFQYGAVPCPRAYVIDENNIVSYTNDHKYDAARTVTGHALVADVLASMQKVGTDAAPVKTSSVGKKPAVAAAPPVFLTPIDGNGVKVESTDTYKKADWDFGTVNQTATKTVEHVIQFRNDTANVIMIDSLQPSCGCTNAYIGNSADFPVPVKPGETVNVTAFVDLTNLYPAAVEKSIMIFKANQIQPLATINITGILTNIN
jgi:peroxiredoxin